MEVRVQSTDDIIIIPVYGDPEGDDTYRIGQIRVPNYSDHPTWQLQISAAYSHSGDIVVDARTKLGEPTPVSMQVLNTTLDFHMSDIPFAKVKER